jgi:ubiquinone/menaquinone biosynthesis C-methylase UbiE
MKPDVQRRVQRYGWDKAAPYYNSGWQKQLKEAQMKLLEKSSFGEGDTVLDVSCGTGLVTEPIAKTVYPTGSVTGVDISDEMIATTRQKYHNSDLDFTLRRMDAEKLSFEKDTFDAAICSLGLMYFPYPEAAVREMYRVVKPGASCSSLVWGAREACGWSSIFPIVDRRVKSEVCPLFFQLGTGDTLNRTYRKAGFREVKSQRFSSKLLFESGEKACTAAFLGGPVALAYQKFNDKTKSEVQEEYLNSIQPFKNGSSYEIPGEFVITSGIK